MKRFEWIDMGIEKISIEDIEKIEKQYYIVLPEQYKKLMLKYNGYALEPCKIVVYDKIEGINTFLNINNDEYGVIATHKIIEDRIGKEIIPFAEEGGGCYFCFDYRECKENPPIVFFDSDVSKCRCIINVSNSFEEFMNSLIELDE